MFKFLLGMGFVHRMVNACRYDVCQSSAGLGHEIYIGGELLSYLWLRGDLLSHIRIGIQQARALPSAIALGKAFAECCTRQRAVGISLHGKGFFAECRMSGTRQRISRVPRWHSAKKSRRDGQVTVTAPFVNCHASVLGKEMCFLFFLKKNALPSVCIWHSAKLVFFFFGFSLPSAVGSHSAKQFVFFLNFLCRVP